MRKLLVHSCDEAYRSGARFHGRSAHHPRYAFDACSAPSGPEESGRSRSTPARFLQLTILLGLLLDLFGDPHTTTKPSGARTVTSSPPCSASRSSPTGRSPSCVARARPRTAGPSALSASPNTQLDRRLAPRRPRRRGLPRHERRGDPLMAMGFSPGGSSRFTTAPRSCSSSWASSGRRRSTSRSWRCSSGSSSARPSSSPPPSPRAAAT